MRILTRFDENLSSDNLGYGVRYRIRSKLLRIGLDVAVFSLDERKTTPL